LCSLYHSACVAEYWHGISVNELDLVLTIQFGLEHLFDPFEVKVCYLGFNFLFEVFLALGYSQVFVFLAGLYILDDPYVEL
jgi:hypothetical protein